MLPVIFHPLRQGQSKRREDKLSGRHEPKLQRLVHPLLRRDREVPREDKLFGPESSPVGSSPFVGILALT